MNSNIKDAYMDVTGKFYVIANSRKTKAFCTCSEFEYALAFAYDVSSILALKTTETNKPYPKILVLIHEKVNGAWRFRKIATFQDGSMIAYDHRRKEFDDGQI